MCRNVALLNVRVHSVEPVYVVTLVKLVNGTFENMMKHSLKDLGEIFVPELLFVCSV